VTFEPNTGGIPKLLSTVSELPHRGGESQGGDFRKSRSTAPGRAVLQNPSPFNNIEKSINANLGPQSVQLSRSDQFDMYDLPDFQPPLVTVPEFTHFPHYDFGTAITGDNGLASLQNFVATDRFEWNDSEDVPVPGIYCSLLTVCF
jgi:hypothetical protein